jgi:hypothetical protein
MTAFTNGKLRREYPSSQKIRVYYEQTLSRLPALPALGKKMRDANLWE